MDGKFLIFQCLIAIASAAIDFSDWSDFEMLSEGEDGEIKQPRPNYHVLIGRFDKRPTLGECHGTIVSKDWIVTSATCVTTSDGKWKEGLKVATNTPESYYGTTLYEVARGFIHPAFARLNRTYHGERLENAIVPVNDIAVLRVQKPISFHKRCSAVQIYDKASKTLENKTGLISGWGLSVKTKPTETAELKIDSQKHCRAYNKDFFAAQLDISKQICTRAVAGIFSWNSEVGAPLIVKGKLVGIASWKHREYGTPLFYTAAAKYRAWIKKVTGVSEWSVGQREGHEKIN